MIRLGIINNIKTNDKANKMKDQMFTFSQLMQVLGIVAGIFGLVAGAFGWLFAWAHKNMIHTIEKDKTEVMAQMHEDKLETNKKIDRLFSELDPIKVDVGMLKLGHNDLKEDIKTLWQRRTEDNIVQQGHGQKIFALQQSIIK